MQQPKGFDDPLHPHHVCKLQRSLYGLKQAPRAWYDKLRSHLYQLGFKRSTSDFSLFYRNVDGALTLILIYVDDILITRDDATSVLQLITDLHNTFALKHLGEVHYFLGIEVAKLNSSTYTLCQTKYLNELLLKVHMSNCKPCPTPMVTSPKLTKTASTPFSDPTLYRSTIGALQYLTLTRPVIAFSVNKLSQFLSNPTDLHWSACKRVLRYLKGTSCLALQFTSSSSLKFVGFSDADYASCPDDRRSTGGHCVFFGANLLLWS